MLLGILSVIVANGLFIIWICAMPTMSMRRMIRPLSLGALVSIPVGIIENALSMLLSGVM